MAKKKKKTALKIAPPKLPKLPKIATFSKVNKKKILIGVAVVAAVALLYFFKGLFVAAVVNGRPVSRLAVIAELEKQNGTSVLQSLITEELIREEAGRNGVTVSADEINAEVAVVEESIKAQGQTLDEALASQGWKRSDLENQIKIQLTVEKLLADKVSVTDQEIDDYIKENESTETRENVKEILRQQKLMEAYQTWMSDLMNKAKVNYFVSY